MISLRAIPMVRLVLPYAIGIVASTFVLQIPAYSILLMFVLCTLCLVFLGKKSLSAHQVSLYYGMTLSVILFIFGLYRIQASNEETERTHFSKQVQLPSQLVGTVSDSPKQGNWWKFTLNIQGTKGDSSEWKATTGNVLVLLPEDALPKEALQYGSQVLLSGNPTRVEKAPNPHQFDYAKYLDTKQIHYQLFVKKGEIQVLNQGKGNLLWQKIYAWRANLLTILQKHLVSEHTFSVGAALLLGYKDDLSTEVRQTFVETGTMHILAVSGAHVGILYGCLSFLFGLLPFFDRRWQIIERCLLILCIWVFVLLTGAAEPAVRAALMFSFYALARVIQRDHNIYNLLGFSAFLMLLYEPRQLFSIGFQFSFGAVLGIALFWSKMRQLVPWKWPKSVKMPLDLIFLGCAAQLGILPLSLYYFHQLPSFFWLTGTLVVPFATLFLWGGILLLFLEMLPFAHVLANLVGRAVDTLLWMMNQMLLFFQALPGHLIENIWISAWMAMLLMVAIYAAAFAAHSHKKIGVYVCLFCTLCVAGGHVNHWWQARQQAQIVMYAAGKNLLIDGFVGTHLSTIHDSISVEKVLFFAKNNRIEAGIRHFSTNVEDTEVFDYCRKIGPVFSCGTNHVAILDKSWRCKKPESFEKIKVDAVLLRGNNPIDIEAQLEIFETNLLLLDNSTRFTQKAKWKAIAEKNNLKWLDLAESAVVF